MTKLQNAMLSVTLLCMMLTGVAQIVPVPAPVRQMSIAAMAVVCFMTSMVFFAALFRKD